MARSIAYFFSDAHFGVSPKGALPNREDNFVRFLKEISNTASHIVLLGDLFEFWYEYRYYVSREHFPLFRTLADLVDSGVKVFYLKGNHDFALDDFFEKTLGVKTSKNLILKTQGLKIYCTHGDGLAKSDKGYRFLRGILDFPLNRKLFRLLHPDFGMALAKQVGKHSRKLGENCVPDLDEYFEGGEKILEKEEADIFVMGHHHKAFVKKIENEKVIASPGQWLYSLNYLKLENGILELHSPKF